MMRLRPIARAMNGQLSPGELDGPVAGISTDTRTLKRGDLFFALRGAAYDGHAFLDEAFAKGAVAAVVDRPADGPCVMVPDTLRALGELAAAWRMTLPARVVGVAGSNGKTTTKDMIGHILAPDRRVVKAQGSFNNSVGVPLTLFQADASTEVAVLEVGTNHPGEMAALGRLARPDLAVLVSIGAEHLEGLGSIEGVAAEEMSFLDHLRAGGAAVVHDDLLILTRLKLPWCRTTVFGFGDRADLRPSEVGPGMRFVVRGVEFVLGLLGEWNLQNALAAAAACERLGVPLEESALRLRDFKGPKMRMERLTLAGVTILNDAYNSNPESAMRAVREFGRFQTGGRRVAVIGDMRELGEHSERYHRDLGRALAETPVDVVVAVGAAAGAVVDEAAPAQERHRFASVEDVRPHLGSLVREGDAVLLKGSRSVGLERLVKWMGERVA
jgi:UDP-N-acetylmuramoyl-tripeptide--D-alanyl-D-alanine ligase